MRVWFESSHVRGGLSSGDLNVRIVREDDERGVSHIESISFEVPRDFHTHNDSVAAALMTLVGKTCRVVVFNFPVSERCAGILRGYYELEDVGPVDPGLEPRRRGQYLGLLLSGGTDSMAVRELLLRVLGSEFKVITTVFGGGFAFEEQGFGRVQRHVSCRTNFRRSRLDRAGRFTTAVPHLFADYLDLGRVTTGHHYNHIPKSVESLRDGRPPAFLIHDQALHAGGLDEAHIVRCLQSVAMQMLAMLIDPALLEASFRASAPSTLSKHYYKGLVFRLCFQRRDAPIPDWLGVVTPPRRKSTLVSDADPVFAELHLLKHFGPDVTRRDVRDIDEYDLSIVDDLRMTYMERYDTNLAQYIPADLRVGALRVFHDAGIVPFDEQDYDELERLRQFSLELFDGLHRAQPHRLRG